jgi:ComF family protein
LNTLRGLAGRLLATLLPPRCLACDGPAAGRELCAACAGELPVNRCACPRCALPLPLPQPAPLCGRCIRRLPRFDQAFAPFTYADPIDRWLGRLKFRNGLVCGRLLGELLADAVEPGFVDGIDALVPVPLHTARLRQRGYNQALELARPLLRRYRLPLWADALRRQRDTPHQIGLDAKTRRRNLRGAFAAEPRVAGRRLLLLDDVITTASTLNEASAELQRAGALEVRVLAVARAAGRG